MRSLPNWLRRSRTICSVITSGRLKMDSFGAGPASILPAASALSPTSFAMDISWRLIFDEGSWPSSGFTNWSGLLIWTLWPLYSMPLSFMPTEAPSGVLKRSSAVFLLSSPPRSSSVTVQANTGAIWRLEACCTALAVTASTAPLKNSMSSWPVQLNERFSSTMERWTSSSSESFGMVSSTGNGSSPERPAGIAVMEKPPVSGPHLDLRFLVPSGVLERFLFLSFLPLDWDRAFSFLILFFLSFLSFLSFFSFLSAFSFLSFLALS
mmetsp:Transcript_16972/g.53501  ORF Transcript_16972/g.53501 Transcript_16972/m.53501 type:complete len:266 (+) Transcript_16972:691-1488(+)